MGKRKRILQVKEKNNNKNILKNRKKGREYSNGGGQIIGHLSRAEITGKLGEGVLSGDRRFELRVIMSLRQWMKSLLNDA